MVQVQSEIVDHGHEQHRRKTNLTHILNKVMQQRVLTTRQFTRENIYGLRMSKLKEAWEELYNMNTSVTTYGPSLRKV